MTILDELILMNSCRLTDIYRSAVETVVRHKVTFESFRI
jgi:hypothetical protein